MEPNLLKCCIPSCFLRPLNRSDRARCPCRLKKFRNRVGPAKPIISISKEMSPSPSTTDHAPSPDHRLHSKFNGETNLYFHEDEVGFCSSKDQVKINGTVNGIVRESSDSDENFPEIDRISVGEELESSLSKTFNQFLSEVYIQLSKSKQLRVVHIKTNEVEGSLSVQRSTGTDCVNSSLTGLTTSSDDEDDDYWFSKWSRRPKLKNTFKVQLRNSKARRAAMLEINSRTTRNSEQEEDKEDPENLKQEIARRSLSPPLFEVFQKTESPLPPPSPKEPSPVGTTETCDARRNSFDGIPVKLVENYDMDEWPTPDEFQQDLDPNGEPTRESAAFTNFAFQFDAEDFENGGDGQERTKTETGDINLTADHALTEGSPVFMFSEPMEEPIKTNGFIRSVSPSTRIESTVVTNGHARAVSPGGQSESLDCSESIVADHSSKPLLFFIHGISGSSDVWKGQFEYFHDLGYEIVAPDLLGHGLSSTPNKAKHYLFESLVQDLVAVFDHFTTDGRRAVIIGHGYGACMGTVLSRIRSQNVILLISVSGGGPTPLIPFGCLERPLLRFRKKKFIGRFDNPELHRVLPDSIHQHILAGQLWVEGDAAFHRKITVPTLLVYGLRDPVVTLVEECEMERTIPKSFLELIPTAGHMVMWDDPANFNRMLITFIEAWADSQT